jgi:hypothetical protein
MSWTIHIPPVPMQEFGRTARLALEQAVPDIRRHNPVGVAPASAAIRAATVIVEGGHVGRGLVGATLQGHANPDHQPRAGWSNDQITITVVCADPQPPAG